MTVKIVKFHKPLIDAPLVKAGYRVSFDVKHDQLPEYNLIFSYMCLTFGYGIRENANSKGSLKNLTINCHRGPGWSISDYKFCRERARLTVVVDTHSRLLL